MLRKFVLGTAVFVFAFAILSVSVIHSASPSYAFATPAPSKLPSGNKAIEINYQFPYQGSIAPDNSLWIFKAIRDRIVFEITRDPLKRAELALLYSDKRLLMSRDLFENKKADTALPTITKGEKYLEVASKQEEVARSKGVDTTSFLTKLALASLKHRQLIEESILPIAPEDARPEIVKTEDYAKNIYKSSRDALNSRGIVAPKDPFDGQ